MPIISIIVPVYKVEPYLNQCIDSILAQTFTDFELILVDDGSPDKCGAICENYAIKDKRINVIHTKNGGLSAARNIGIDNAKGSYLGFVDSDDYIEPDMYDFLYKNIKMHNADLATCGLYNCYESHMDCVCKEKFSLTVDSVQAISYALKGKYMTVNAVNKLYKREIFDDLRYPIGKTTEDAFLIVDVLLRASTIHVDTTPKYYYVHRGSSITTGEFGVNDLCVLEAYEKNLMLICEYCPQLENVAYFSLWWAHRYLLNRLALQTSKVKVAYKKIIEKAASHIRHELWKILFSHETSFLQKCAYVVTSISPYFYMHLYRCWIIFTKKWENGEKNG